MKLICCTLFQVSKGEDPQTSHEGLVTGIVKWGMEGKNVSKFDRIWMGLGMLAIPPTYFGWESITKTMKVVSKCIRPSLPTNNIVLLHQII